MREDDEAPLKTLLEQAWLPYALCTLTMVFYAFSNAIGRGYYADLPPVAFSFWRVVAASAILLPFVWVQLRRRWPVVVEHWRSLTLAAVLQTGLGQVLFYWGLHTTTATNASLITAAQPVAVVTFAWLLLRERMTAVQGAGIAVAAAGVVVIVARGEPATLMGLDIVLGDLFAAIAVACWGLYAILIRRLTPVLTPFVMLEALAVLSVVTTFPLYIAELAWSPQVMRVDAETVAVIVGVAVFATILALSFMIYGIGRIGPARASAFNYLQSPFTAVVAAIFLGEVFELYHAAGLALTLTGVYFANRPDRIRLGRRRA